MDEKWSVGRRGKRGAGAPFSDSHEGASPVGSEPESWQQLGSSRQARLDAITNDPQTSVSRSR